MTHDQTFSPGLRGVVAAETRLSHVDGLAGELIIAGYALEDIAPHATFEQMAFLLWNDRLPSNAELTAFDAVLKARRMLSPATLSLLTSASERRLPVMTALRMAAGTLDLTLETDDPREAAQTLTAAFPSIVAAYWRLLDGQQPLTPRDDLSHTANYLYMLTGDEPESNQIRALETYLNTVMDHGLNASTFTARVIISTASDMVSAVVGAVGALKGIRHGGAPGPALDMVFEIGTPDNAESYLRRKLDAGKLLMGFGHRVYKVRDPRADVLAHAAEQFFAGRDSDDLYGLALHVEAVALRLLEEYKPGRNLQTNVEFYTALLLHGIGLSSDLFSPSFAVARAVGWIAHAFEQIDEGSIIRPQSVYSGKRGRRYADG
jgi:citrate synthase